MERTVQCFSLQMSLYIQLSECTQEEFSSLTQIYLDVLHACLFPACAYGCLGFWHMFAIGKLSIVYHGLNMTVPKSFTQKG